MLVDVHTSGRLVVLHSESSHVWQAVSGTASCARSRGRFAVVHVCCHRSYCMLIALPKRVVYTACPFFLRLAEFYLCDLCLACNLRQSVLGCRRARLVCRKGGRTVSQKQSYSAPVRLSGSLWACIMFRSRPLASRRGWRCSKAPPKAASWCRDKGHAPRGNLCNVHGC